MNRGVVLALSAYIFWGLHPIYWKQLKDVPSPEIVSHRIFWSLVFFVMVISFRKGWKQLFCKIRESNKKWILFTPAFLIGSNWAMYIWAVNAGYVIETSLGYFICPLISVFLGVLFLHEKLRKIQWLAIIIAGMGVLVMTLMYGQFPWISLYLALTWGLYGLLRKTSTLKPAEGLLLETLIMVIPAMAYFILLLHSNSGSFFVNTKTTFLLMGTGLISGVPLIVFIAGARQINLSLIGILQYVYPTLIFACGYFLYHELLNEGKVIGFVFIWTAIFLYSV